MRVLSLRAGPDAIRLLNERGLRAEDVDIIPGASGGPKWLASVKPICPTDGFRIAGTLPR